MTFSILIATYGENHWRDMARDRAYPSALRQGADSVHIGHFPSYSIAEARNELAFETNAEWLVFLDADDELEAGYIDAMRKEADRLAVPAILAPRVSYVLRGRRRPARLLRQGNLQDDNFIVVGAGIQNSLFREVGGFSDYPHGFEDWSLWAKAWKAGARVVEIPRAVYIAYVNEHSKHRTGWRDREWQVATHHRVRRDLFPELYAE